MISQFAVIVVGFAVFVAYQVESPLIRLGAIAVAILLAGALVLWIKRDSPWLSAEYVRVVQDVPRVQLTRQYPMTEFALIYCGGIVIAAGMLAMISSTELSRGGGLGAVIVGAVMVLVALALWRTSRGLTLRPQGVSVRQGMSRRHANWTLVKGVTVAKRWGRVAVRIDLREGDPICVSGRTTGSDPTTVAAIVRFFSEHPDYRGKLDNFHDAIDIFERKH